MKAFGTEMISTLKRILPRHLYVKLVDNPLYSGVLKTVYRTFGRPKREAETTKARLRREKEFFFERFCQGNGLDIGYGGDLLSQNCRGWDFEDGDAQYLKGINDCQFDFVYSSHTLEHMPFPEIALKNWWRVLKPSGFMILYLPHRDLYEKKCSLPSRWNYDHKHYFLPDRDELPSTLGLMPLLARSIGQYEVIYVRECSEGHTIIDPYLHSNGEYSIEIVLRKR
jgi:SAM-dependent methyltransferase